MFVFHCHECSGSFKIYLENLVNMQEITCPNCKQQITDEALSYLRTIGASYRETIDVFKRTMREGAGWSISIAEYDEHRPGLKCCVSESTINREDIRHESYWERPVTKEYQLISRLKKNQNT